MRTLLIGVPVALVAMVGAHAQAPVFHWETDLQEATAKAEKQGKPMLVGFR